LAATQILEEETTAEEEPSTEPAKETKPAKEEKKRKAKATEETTESKEEDEAAPEEEQKRYEFIEDIPGVGPATAEKLQEMGFHTVESLATATIKELTTAGVGEKQAAKVIAAARNGLALTFITADELIKMRQNVKRLSTASKQLDE